MDIPSVSLRGEHVDLMIMVSLMVYLITAFEITFISGHHFCSNSVTLLPSFFSFNNLFVLVGG